MDDINKRLLELLEASRRQTVADLAADPTNATLVQALATVQGAIQGLHEEMIRQAPRLGH